MANASSSIDGLIHFSVLKQPFQIALLCVCFNLSQQSALYPAQSRAQLGSSSGITASTSTAMTNLSVRTIRVRVTRFPGNSHRHFSSLKCTVTNLATLLVFKNDQTAMISVPSGKHLFNFDR